MKIYVSPSRQTANLYATGGTNEAVQCQAIGELVGELLQKYKDTEVYVAPASQTALERGDQAKAEGYDCMLCLHTNASGSASKGQANGTLGIYYQGDYKTVTLSEEQILRNKEFAQKLVESVSQLTGKDLGVKATQQTELVFCGCTGALIEFEFHDNQYGSDYIQEHHKELAEAAVTAVADFFGLQQKSEEEPPAEDDRFYCVQCGAYKDKENAQRQLERLQAAGFSCYIIIKNTDSKTYEDYHGA